jgi:precorrin-2 dehydrogenase/sirohydrochlorin ferrochelatase
VSLLPIAVEGDGLTAVVVGGGPVAARKASAFLSAGMDIRIIAPQTGPEVDALLATATKVQLVRESYRAGHLAGAVLAVAATDSHEVNRQVAADARGQGILVNAADGGEDGTFVSMAQHRAGELVIGIAAGRVPAAAQRIRDSLADRFDDRYARALAVVSGIRRRVLDSAGTEEWRTVSERLIGPDFCAAVEEGRFGEGVESWR